MPPVEEIQAFVPTMYAPTNEVLAYFAAFNAGTLPPTKANLECEELLRATALKMSQRNPVSSGITSESCATAVQPLAPSEKGEIERLEAVITATHKKIERAVATLRKAEAEGIEATKALDAARKKLEPGFLASIRQSSQKVIDIYGGSARLSARMSTRMSSRKKHRAQPVPKEDTTQPALGSVGNESSSSREGTMSTTNKPGRKMANRSVDEANSHLKHVAGSKMEATLDRALEFDPRVEDILRVASLSMFYVFMLVVLFSAPAVGLVMGLRWVLATSSNSDWSSNNVACVCCFSTAAIALGTCYSLIGWKSLSLHQRCQPMAVARFLASACTFPFCGVIACMVWVTSSQRAIPGPFFGGMALVTAILTTRHLSLECMHQHRRNALVGASRAASDIERFASESENTTAATEERALRVSSRKWWQTLLHAVKFNFHVYIVYFAMFVYVFGIFRVLESARSISGGPEIMFVIGLLVKVGGNKYLMLTLKNNRKVPLWLSNIAVLAYEYVTALLIRMILLSVPNESSAVYLSLFNAAVELMVRTWFFVAYISKGGKIHAGLAVSTSESDKFHRAYVRRGQLRVMDGCNDSIVEYVTMVAAAVVLAVLPQTGTFDLPAVGNVPLRSLARVLSVQIGTELVVDAFMFSLEAKGGMIPLQRQHWKYLPFRVVVMQFSIVAGFTSFVLGCLLST